MGPNDNNADEVVDDVHADDRNICKAIAFRLWNILQKVSLLPICGIFGKKELKTLFYVFGYLVKSR